MFDFLKRKPKIDPKLLQAQKDRDTLEGIVNRQGAGRIVQIIFDGWFAHDYNWRSAFLYALVKEQLKGYHVHKNPPKDEPKAQP